MSKPYLLLLILPAIGCSSEPSAPEVSNPMRPQFTAGFNVSREDLAQATFDIGKVRRETGNWEFELEAKPSLEVAIRRHTYAANSYTGWHQHPGPVLIQVVQGTVTFYEADDPDCTPIVVGAGQSYVDLGEHGHIGRNEEATTAVDYTVLFGPPDLTPQQFRIDIPRPGNCPF
jgi:hypothetical protein